ncbi:hypothetical protein BN940_12101 [Castellaniella defragrans 65Phen]|uniref:Uncharacterized protein n=1 Tax=Castellaniella defragrans (strain DSM 12143 / CCUG 39792 / 65Phen) TaxID=1437824 RepID=W8X4K3_CASD6|nr:hypothetical protein BN940_12101 [Castellaniella defragrans 65Phen]
MVLHERAPSVVASRSRRRPAGRASPAGGRLPPARNLPGRRVSGGMASPLFLTVGDTMIGAWRGWAECSFRR